MIDLNILVSTLLKVEQEIQLLYGEKTWLGQSLNQANQNWRLLYPLIWLFDHVGLNH